MIPKQLHFMWLPDFRKAPVEQSANPVKWGDLNPEYEINLWDEGLARELIGDCYPAYLKVWENLPKEVMKADLARLLVIHHFGGIYLDLDLIPKSPLSALFDRPVIYNKHLKLTKSMPQVPSEDPCDLKAAKTILSREHCAIDNVGVGVANGVILSEPGVDWIMEFVELQKFASKGLVLDFVGTWALTRFIRSRVSQLRSDGLVCLPPHYFLWEQRYFDCEPTDYTVSIHPEGNSWGDHTKPQWWKV